jgi:2-dehydro-3-deoxygluconokinase
MNKKIFTCGEVLLRLTVDVGERFENAKIFNVYVAGSEANTSVALSRLGFNVLFFTSLPDNPLGKRIEKELKIQGINTEILWEKEGRLGIFFYEKGSYPRSARVVYDRKSSSFSKIKKTQFNFSILKKHNLIHCSGITPALSENNYELTKEIFKFAKKYKKFISFDVNYRRKLWKKEDAEKKLKLLCKIADLVFCSEEDAEEVFSVSKGTSQKKLQDLKKIFGDKIIVLTLKEGGGAMLYKDKFLIEKGCGVDVVERLGAGDAFSAGFIYGFFKKGINNAINYANKVCGLKFSFKSDFCLLEKEEVENFLEGRDVKR